MAGQGPVERATRAHLRRLGVSVQTEARAAAVVRLAVLVDGARGAESAAVAVGQMRLIIDGLEKSAVRPEKDVVDELNARRAVKRPAVR